ncbi:hypothetical protein V9K67_04410 [Paraflavisolibacter sp. H34]|uniref:hypothetical protein n=1 Tax=Huijunlia imazamoxiresistens TaxID=3127457 RepID=UPI00301954D4
MKQNLLLSASLGLFLLLAHPLHAQENEGRTLSPVTIVSYQVQPKVIRAFERSFKNAADPVWSKIGEKFLVRFTREGLKQHALFGKQGSLVYHLTFGGEKNLPETVQNLVNGKYSGYSIVAATHIENEERNIWEVKLEGMRNLVSVHVENDEVAEVESFRKAL